MGGSPNQKSAICQKTPKTSPPVLSYHPWSDIQSHFYNGFLEGKHQEQVKSQTKEMKSWERPGEGSLLSLCIGYKVFLGCGKK